MELTALEIAYIAGGFGIIGSIVGSLTNHFLSKDTTMRNDFNKAAAALRNVFLTELSGLYPYPIKWPKNIVEFLESKFIVLNAAVSEFRHYLPSKKWDAFDKAWFSFYNATGREIDNKNCQCYRHYISGESTTNPNGKEITEIIDGKENLKHNIDNLIKYAKQI